MFNVQSFRIECADESALYGSLQGAANININTAHALTHLFQEYNIEVLIATGRLLGVKHYNEKYCSTHSHSFGPKRA